MTSLRFEFRHSELQYEFGVSEVNPNPNSNSKTNPNPNKRQDCWDSLGSEHCT